jgi:hypothetical protein
MKREWKKIAKIKSEKKSIKKSKKISTNPSNEIKNKNQRL